MFMKLYRQNTKDGINVSAGLKVKVRIKCRYEKKNFWKSIGESKGFPIQGGWGGATSGFRTPPPPHICPLLLVFSSPIQIWFPAEWSCFIVETVLKYLN